MSKYSEHILAIDKELEDLKARASLLGKHKMWCFGLGHRTDRTKTFDSFIQINSAEDQEVTENGLDCRYDDSYYDCRDITGIGVTWQELENSIEGNILAWQTQFKEEQKEKNRLRKEVEKERKNKSKEIEYKNYLKLKEKYETEN